MLADFQQALSDITASPALCRALRADPTVLRDRYALTEREAARLCAIAAHPGMNAANRSMTARSSSGGSG